jgi:hypothetical protein
MKMKRTPIRGFLQDVSGFSDEQTLFFLPVPQLPYTSACFIATRSTPVEHPYHARGTPGPRSWNAWTTLVERLDHARGTPTYLAFSA